jgi:hypothetical protein
MTPGYLNRGRAKHDKEIARAARRAFKAEKRAIRREDRQSVVQPMPKWLNGAPSLSPTIDH